MIGRRGRRRYPTRSASAWRGGCRRSQRRRCQLGIWAEEHLGIPAGQGAFAMLAPTEYRRAASGEAATVREKAVAAALAREEREL